MGNQGNHHHHEKTLPIAIIGGSFSGLTLANVLYLHSIPYTIFDSRSFPFTHVMGGAKFNIPSYELVAKKLGLDHTQPPPLPLPPKYSKNNNGDDGPTRKDVIDALLKRVESNLVTSQRIVRIELKSSGLFYLHSQQQIYKPNRHRDGWSSDTRIIGPFQFVVGADGVLSKVRISALQNTFLVGDARWVNDRWYDLGLRRIDRGADMALLDGLELGYAMVKREDQISSSQEALTRRKFCARVIAWRRSMRILAIAATIFVVVLFKFFNGNLPLFSES
mmetsp:Transcript_19706/g.36981  ORF Transcript_19706/g.36981 Transcript_19706/m.36981 type:complete len:277 (+) Transcript_19706:241-1071(+)